MFSRKQIGGNTSEQAFQPPDPRIRPPDMRDAAGDRVRVDAQMQPGTTDESIVVQGLAPGLQTDSSASGDMRGEESVQDLPLNGRNYGWL